MELKNRDLFELIAEYAVSMMRHMGAWDNLGLPDVHWMRRRVDLHNSIRDLVKDLGVPNTQVIEIGREVTMSTVQMYHHETMAALKNTITTWYGMCLGIEWKAAIPIINNLWDHTDLKELMYRGMN